MFGKQFVDGLSNGRRYLLKEGMAYEYNKIVERELDERLVRIN
jgi:hypothetical protein